LRDVRARLRMPIYSEHEHGSGARGGTMSEHERERDLVREAQEIEDDVAPGREPGDDEPPTEASTND
jgi:hypothetical protein